MLKGSYYNGFAPRDGMPLYPSLWKGCVGAWAPCLGPTGLTLRDWSGFHRHGSLANLTADKWANDNLLFDTLQNRVYTTATSTVIMPSNQFAVSVWFRQTTTQPSSFGGYLLADFNAAGSQLGIALRIGDSANLQAFSRSDAADLISVSSAVTTGELIHVVYQATAANAKTLWKNGSQIGSSTVSITRGAGGLTAIGGPGEYVSIDLTFRGRIYDVRLYNRALSPNEIKALASRVGIAYDMMPMAMPYSEQVAFQAAWALRQRLILGGGGGLG